MPPLILHNVPDDELYIGEDGIQRPYAMVFPGSDGYSGASRTKKHAPETGSFGKSTRRSRSRGTPAKREDPTILAADAIFSRYLSEHASAPPESQRKTSAGSSQTNIGETTSSASPFVQKEPTEVILRGFKSSHQYAAIKHFENIAGLICEDYPRDPPMEQRRFKADIRDSNTYRTRSLTPEERAKALRFAGGENWIKITFESAEAAEAAVYASPQTILGYLVYAEPYRGVPPTNEDEIPAVLVDRPSRRNQFSSHTVGPSSGVSSGVGRKPSSTLPRSFTAPSTAQGGRLHPHSLSPPGSQTSSTTLDTATLSTADSSSTSATLSSSTVVGAITSQSHSSEQPPDSIYCRRIPTAKRIQLRPADQALLPQPSYSQRILAQIPWLAFFSANIIGTEIPRTENGEFDWELASLYWRLWWWLDFNFGLCGGDVAGGADKDS